MRKGYERVRADISLDAILANMESMKRNLKEGVQIAAVLKTNAYGHGAVEIAKVLEPLDYVWGYAVAAFEEAVELSALPYFGKTCWNSCPRRQKLPERRLKYILLWIPA